LQADVLGNAGQAALKMPDGRARGAAADGSSERPDGRPGGDGAWRSRRLEGLKIAGPS